MKSTWLFLLFTSLRFFTLAQEALFDFGARNTGLGGASSTLSDPYCLFNNVGGLGRIENHSLFAGYQSRFNLSAFQVIGGGAVLHHSLGNVGVSYFKFGDDLFSEQKLQLAAGNEFDMVSLGLALDWIQYAIESIGTRRVLCFQFGGIVELTPSWFVAAHIFNINQAKLVRNTGEQVPTAMKGGISFRPTTELMLNAEVVKQLGTDEAFRVGLEYNIFDDVFVRTGINTQPLNGAFGIGFHPNKFSFDYAFSNAADLGNSHEFSLAYRLIR